MLEMKHLAKQYKTGSFVQNALKDVSLTLRDNEFVFILGPSGSGKTTLLNIIGGLDRYDSGDLIIDGVSTKQYKDRDWDAYRNHSIGFVFQSYNLIPHQTILSNVELALTIGGVSKQERRQRAIEALREVGLEEHMHKKPNQLSGGQMQRVAIARALVNNPEILLADEPTGALDSDTSIQVMELLKKVANHRLVVMVTHNAELATAYATRIVTLRDGQITSDTNPYNPQGPLPTNKRKTGKASLNLRTAAMLSMHNLWEKRTRTLLVSLAGSIGIIGIALILALSNGANEYIADIESETLSEYPLEITATGYDLTSLLFNMGGSVNASMNSSDDDVSVISAMTSMFASTTTNDLASLKLYLESGESDIDLYAKAIEYSYDIEPEIYLLEDDGDIWQVSPDSIFTSAGLSTSYSSNAVLSSLSSYSVFYELPTTTSLYESQYEVVAGKWPDSYDECVLVLTSTGAISDTLMYTLGLRDTSELEDIIASYMETDQIHSKSYNDSYTYDDLLAATFQLVIASDYYTYDEDTGLWVDNSSDDAYVASLVEEGVTLKIVGIVIPYEESATAVLSTGIYYTEDLITYIVEQSATSEVVLAQMADEDTNVLTGDSFDAQTSTSIDLSSMFTIDADALNSLFSLEDIEIDVSEYLDFSSLDLSSLDVDLDLDLSDIEIDLSDISIELDEDALSSLASSITIDASEEEISAFVSQLLVDYQTYMSENNDADMQDYLSSDSAQTLIAETIVDWIDTDSLQTQLEAIISDAISQALESVMEDVTAQIEASIEAAMASMMSEIATQIASALETSMSEMMEAISESIESAFSFDMDSLSEIITFDMDSDELTQLLTSMSSSSASTYEDNLLAMGWVDFGNPTTISIYPKDFESKDAIVEILDDYNDQMEASGEEDKVITYTDVVGTLMSSVTQIINNISYLLIAFVAVSLIVSSIMIGVITYISVLERQKEIGILRALGASKRNITQIFNAETFIIGLCAGALGVLLSYLLLIPINGIIEHLTNSTDMQAILNPLPALALAGLSVILTLISGWIPSRKASKSDPVAALRTE